MLAVLSRLKPNYDKDYYVRNGCMDLGAATDSISFAANM
jgi:hypothetical protein